MAIAAVHPDPPASALDTIVIGAGQAGLAVSRLLSKHGIPHVVFERGRIGDSWRRQRWDSFRVNTPNEINQLPDGGLPSGGPQEFCTGDELVRYFEEYSRRYGLAVQEGVHVQAVRPAEGGFEVKASGRRYRCRNVVVCSGDQNLPLKPLVAAELPDDILQVHAADYRGSDQLPGGATLVVGSGQSGVQIVEDLLDARRRVYLCTSKVGRVPRRYRGKDITAWIELAGLAEQRPEDLQDPDEVYARQVQISGTRGGHSVSLHELGRRGAILLGRLERVRGRVLHIGRDLQANVAKGDEVSAQIRGAIDAFIAKAGLDAPPAEPDPTDAPFEGLWAMSRVHELKLDETQILSVIWATGFGGDFSYLDPSFLDERGRPAHQDGICPVPGLYCVGLTWLRRRISGLVGGVASDAEYVVSEIVKRRASTPVLSVESTR